MEVARDSAGQRRFATRSKVVALSAGDTAHIAWPTVVGGADPEGAIFYATTRDGQQFTARRRVPPGASRGRGVTLARLRATLRYDSGWWRRFASGHGVRSRWRTR